MQSLDSILHKRASNTYTCRHWLRDAWLLLTDEDLERTLPRLFGFKIPPVAMGRVTILLQKPESPCIVLMEKKGDHSHVGVYVDNCIAHLTDSHGVEFQPANIATRGFDKVRYYK
jgi:hypothetical protein